MSRLKNTPDLEAKLFVNELKTTGRFDKWPDDDQINFLFQLIEKHHNTIAQQLFANSNLQYNSMFQEQTAIEKAIHADNLTFAEILLSDDFYAPRINNPSILENLIRDKVRNRFLQKIIFNAKFENINLETDNSITNLCFKHGNEELLLNIIASISSPQKVPACVQDMLRSAIIHGHSHIVAEYIKCIPQSSHLCNPNSIYLPPDTYLFNFSDFLLSDLQFRHDPQISLEICQSIFCKISQIIEDKKYTHYFIKKEFDFLYNPEFKIGQEVTNLFNIAYQQSYYEVCDLILTYVENQESIINQLNCDIWKKPARMLQDILAQFPVTNQLTLKLDPIPEIIDYQSPNIHSKVPEIIEKIEI